MSALVRHGLRLDGQLRQVSQRLLQSDLPASVLDPMRALVEHLARESQAAGPASSSSAVGGSSGSGDAVAQPQQPQPPPQQPQPQAACWKCGKAGGQLRNCSRCGVARYCGAECQRAHWKDHKPECKPKGS